VLLWTIVIWSAKTFEGDPGLGFAQPGSLLAGSWTGSRLHVFRNGTSRRSSSLFLRCTSGRV